MADSATLAPAPESGFEKAPTLDARRVLTGREGDLVALLEAARGGDELAWSQLVARLDHVPRAVARSYRLTSADAEDVVQFTWLQLFMHIDRLREPRALAGWMATVARREAQRLLHRPARERLTEDPGSDEIVDSPGPEDELLAAELRDTLAQALATLPERHRDLMALVADDFAPDYRQISARLAMPVGSIGPIRARSLARLRRHPKLRRLALS